MLLPARSRQLFGVNATNLLDLFVPGLEIADIEGKDAVRAATPATIVGQWPLGLWRQLGFWNRGFIVCAHGSHFSALRPTDRAVAIYNHRESTTPEQTDEPNDAPDLR